MIKQKINYANVILVILLSFTALFIIGILRPEERKDNKSISRDIFWRKKIDAGPEFDIVFGGDSRVMCDVSPKAVEKVLQGKKILNFGFNFAAYSSEYLRALESKVNSNSKDKIIILGITARSLTPLNFEASTFRKEAHKSRFERWSQYLFSDLFEFFRPFSIATIFQKFKGYSIYRDCYPDGYMAVYFQPLQPKQDLETYQKIFIDNKINPNNIDTIGIFVKKWNQKGIKVYGFFPPRSNEIQKAESTNSGLNEMDFKVKFLHWGGKWISIEDSKYRLSDGSHIDGSNTELYSKELANHIKYK